MRISRAKGYGLLLCIAGEILSFWACKSPRNGTSGSVKDGMSTTSDPSIYSRWTTQFDLPSNLRDTILANEADIVAQSRALVEGMTRRLKDTSGDQLIDGSAKYMYDEMSKLIPPLIDVVSTAKGTKYTPDEAQAITNKVSPKLRESAERSAVAVKKMKGNTKDFLLKYLGVDFDNDERPLRLENLELAKASDEISGSPGFALGDHDIDVGFAMTEMGFVLAIAGLVGSLWINPASIAFVGITIFGTVGGTIGLIYMIWTVF